MQKKIQIYLFLVLGLVWLLITACSPLDYFIVTRSSGGPPTPEMKGVVATVVTQPTAAPSTNTPARPQPSATFTPGSNGPQAGWETYTSAVYQYALSYPADWSVAVDRPGTQGEARNVERVIFKQPNYGKPNQFSTITIEAAEGAYTTTAQCQGQTAVISGIKGCRRSLPKAQNPAQEIVLFQAPALGHAPAYFYIQLVYDDAKYVDVFNQMLGLFKFTAAGAIPSPVPATAGATKTYKSDKYGYVMNYPANWAIKVQTVGPSGPGRDPEYVFLTSPGGGLPQVQVMALRGAPPITGFENCDKNLQFRGIPACSISISGGQQPPTQMLIFQKGDAYFHMGIQYETQTQLGVFDDILRSLQFTP